MAPTLRKQKLKVHLRIWLYGTQVQVPIVVVYTVFFLLSVSGLYRYRSQYYSNNNFVVFLKKHKSCMTSPPQ